MTSQILFSLQFRRTTHRLESDLCHSIALLLKPLGDLLGFAITVFMDIRTGNCGITPPPTRCCFCINSSIVPIILGFFPLRRRGLEWQAQGAAAVRPFLAVLILPYHLHRAWLWRCRWRLPSSRVSGFGAPLSSLRKSFTSMDCGWIIASIHIVANFIHNVHHRFWNFGKARPHGVVQSLVCGAKMKSQLTTT